MPKHHQPPTRGDIPDVPWRRVRFVPARTAAEFPDGGTVHAEVFLPHLEILTRTQQAHAAQNDGSWHAVRFATDGEGFRKLAALPDPARERLFSALARLPLHAGQVRAKGQRGRPRGRNTPANLDAWFTARYLGDVLMQWLAEPATKQTAPYHRACAVWRNGRGDACPDDRHLVAFLVDRNWQNAHYLNPSRFPEWTGARDPIRFARQLDNQLKKDPLRTLIMVTTPDKLIGGILADPPEAKGVYIFGAPESRRGRFVPMTDFRIY